MPVRCNVKPAPVCCIYADMPVHGTMTTKTTAYEATQQQQSKKMMADLLCDYYGI